MLILVFVPNKAAKPVPAFMKHSFNDTKSRDFDAHPLQLLKEQGTLMKRKDFLQQAIQEYLKKRHLPA